MSEESPITFSDPWNAPVTFVNTVINQGHFNAVVNVTLGTYNFTPVSGKVEPDLVITSRLRMDLACAKQLRDALDAILTQATKQTGETEH